MSMIYKNVWLPPYNLFIERNNNTTYFTSYKEYLYCNQTVNNMSMIYEYVWLLPYNLFIDRNNNTTYFTFYKAYILF